MILTLTSGSTVAGMNLSGATALVTGTNRGIGRHLAAQLIARGAKVYATARRPELIDLEGAERLALDITSPRPSQRPPRSRPTSIS